MWMSHWHLHYNMFLWQTACRVYTLDCAVMSSMVMKILCFCFFTDAIQMSLTLAVCFAMTVFLLWSISDDDSCFLFHWFVGERLGPLTPTLTPMLFLQERIYDATAVHICLLEVSIMEKNIMYIETRYFWHHLLNKFTLILVFFKY